MRIAQVSPLYESVPPKLYGGTERVVSWLTEELVNQGHDVTLFASGDSKTRATLAPMTDQALRLNPKAVDHLAHHVYMLEQVYNRLDDFDIVHFHVDYLHFSLMRRIGAPHVTTLHGRIDLDDLKPIFREFSGMPVVSISNSQRRPAMHLNWRGTVYHGLSAERFKFHPEPGEYLAFLGRISPEKRVDRAIKIAQEVGLPLKIAAKIDRVDRDYFEREIEPLLSDPLVAYIGEIGDDQKEEFLGNARALLFPIDWPEPFGLVMIEAMACGTPVVAFGCGSVPEVIDDGVSGFVVDSMQEAIAATDRIDSISRLRCRRTFERRFSAERMANDYLDIYREQAILLPEPLLEPVGIGAAAIG